MSFIRLEIIYSTLFAKRVFMNSIYDMLLNFWRILGTINQYLFQNIDSFYNIVKH